MRKRRIVSAVIIGVIAGAALAEILRRTLLGG
jgi:hypothetical protein